MKSLSKFLLSGLVLASLSMPSYAQGLNENKTQVNEKSKETINWYSLDDGLEKSEVEKKPLMIVFHADWCQYCIKFEEETFSNQKIINYLNKNYVPVKVNVDSEKPLKIGNKIIQENEVADLLKVGAYPTTLFFSSKGKPIDGVEGFVDAKHMYEYISEIYEENKNISKTKFELNEDYKGQTI